MARIISWQHKLLQNKEAEKRIFFLSLSAPFFFSHLSYIPVPIRHLYWLNILHKVQREDSFFFFPPPTRAESYEMQIYRLNSHQVQFERGTRIFIWHEKLFSACTNTALEPMRSSSAELIKYSTRSEARFSFHGWGVWIESHWSDLLTIWCSVPFVHTVLVAGKVWNATEV